MIPSLYVYNSFPCNSSMELQTFGIIGRNNKQSLFLHNKHCHALSHSLGVHSNCVPITQGWYRGGEREDHNSPWRQRNESSLFLSLHLLLPRESTSQPLFVFLLSHSCDQPNFDLKRHEKKFKVIFPYKSKSNVDEWVCLMLAGWVLVLLL